VFLREEEFALLALQSPPGAHPALQCPQHALVEAIRIAL
jgi:hypothetical protein